MGSQKTGLSCMGDVATQAVFVLERPQLDGSR